MFWYAWNVAFCLSVLYSRFGSPPKPPRLAPRWPSPAYRRWKQKGHSCDMRQLHENEKSTTTSQTRHNGYDSDSNFGQRKSRLIGKGQRYSTNTYQSKCRISKPPLKKLLTEVHWSNPPFQAPDPLYPWKYPARWRSKVSKFNGLRNLSKARPLHFFIFFHHSVSCHLTNLAKSTFFDLFWPPPNQLNQALYPSHRHPDPSS